MTRQFKAKKPSAPGIRPIRLLRCMIGQGALTYTCPSTPRLDGKLALVTGASRGIGAEIAKGLVSRGASVINCSRSVNDSDIQFGQSKPSILPIQTDLGSLRSIGAAIKNLTIRLGDAKIDLVVANAGIFPNEYSETENGFESAFAVNCLGHFALLSGLMRAGLLAQRARVVGTAGDIYIMADDCSSNFKGTAQQLYCRSKLGTMWMYLEMARRFAQFDTVIVHPGVVDSGLSGANTPALVRRLMISSELGSQASLIAATQPDIINGCYFHNTRGLLKLGETDAATDTIRSKAFWELLEKICIAHFK